MLETRENSVKCEKRALPIIRDACLADIDSVLEVENASFEPSQRYPLYIFEYYVKRGSIFKVAEQDGRIVGYVLAKLENGICHLLSVAVLPEYRGIGIGGALVEKAIEECRKRGAIAAYLEVHVENVIAVHLYRKLGFKVIGLINNYYGEGKNAYLMYKEL